MAWWMVAVLAGVAAVSASEPRPVSQTATLRWKDEDDEKTCPFVYDEYRMNLDGLELVFRPADYGFSHGYYCSVSGPNVAYRFGNCSCPAARYCQDDWGVMTLDFFGQTRDFNVGRCTFYNWAILAPLAAAMALCFCGVCLCSRRRAKREVILLRVEPGHEYVNLE